jgi:hypothetical protein
MDIEAPHFDKPDREIKTTKVFPARTWLVLFFLALTGQIAWAIENTWFNTFVFDTLTPDSRPVAWMVAASAVTATLNGEAGFIPTPIIFQVGAVIGLAAILPLLFIKQPAAPVASQE